MEKIYDTAVVGGGIAGYSAALTLKSLKSDCIWLGAEGFGKALRAEYVRNYPAFSGNGAEFCKALSAQAEQEGVSLTPARVDGIFSAGDFFVITHGGAETRARAVVLATGVEVSGGIAGEREFTGRGVSYCAVCDGALYRGKKICVLLGSEEFAEEAEYLAGFALEVTVFCSYRNPKFRAGNIKIGEGKPLAVEGNARVERLITDKGDVPADGVFLLKNSVPPSALVGGLETDGAHVKTAKDGSTNLAGLFCAGDVTGKPYQYVIAAGEGCAAAYSAHAYVLRVKKEGKA